MIRLTSNAKVQKCKLKSENGAINNPSAETFSSVSGSPDRGRLPENTVYLQLRRSGQEVWYFKARRSVISFAGKRKIPFLPSRFPGR
jgi:predicted AAA+ superfamily ATPase